MPINLQNEQNIGTGWPGPPQLSAPSIGGLVEAILKNRQFQQLDTERNIASAIKQIQSQREGGAYQEALRNAGLTQGQDISGLGSANATRLAQLIAQQTPDTDMDALHRAMAEHYGAATNKENTIADYIKQYGTTPGRGHPGVDFSEHALGDTWIDPDDGLRRIMTTTGPKLVGSTLQPTDVRAQNQNQILSEQNQLLQNKSVMDAEIATERTKNEAAGKANVPYSRSDEYNRTVNRLKQIQSGGLAPSTDVPTPQARPTPPPADKNLAPGYGVPAQEPNKPVTQGEHIDAATVKQYIAKAGGDRDKARQMAAADGWSF